MIFIIDISEFWKLIFLIPSQYKLKGNFFCDILIFTRIFLVIFKRTSIFLLFITIPLILSSFLWFRSQFAIQTTLLPSLLVHLSIHSTYYKAKSLQQSLRKIRCSAFLSQVSVCRALVGIVCISQNQLHKTKSILILCRQTRVFFVSYGKNLQKELRLLDFGYLIGHAFRSRRWKRHLHISALGFLYCYWCIGYVPYWLK